MGIVRPKLLNKPPGGFIELYGVPLIEIQILTV